MDINRRQFLAALIGMGAVITLPVEIAEASESQVNAAWKRMAKDPWFFEVNDAGTITEPGDDEPKTNADIYDDISVSWLTTPEAILNEVERYDELRSRFQTIAMDEIEVVDEKLDEDTLSPYARRKLKKLRKALEDEDNGWQDLVLYEGKSGVPRFQEAIADWLDDSPNWNAMEHWPSGWSGQGRAKQFFEGMDYDLVDQLGVVIVEGEHPGSTYYAAELRQEIKDANEVAEKLGLPFRFKAEGT